MTKIAGFTIFFSVAVMLASFSQTEQGAWLAGGGAAINSNLTDPYQDKFAISLWPTAGYFIKDNLALGSALQFSVGWGDYYNSISFGGAPFIRYYFGLNPQLKLLIHTQSGYTGSYFWADYIDNYYNYIYADIGAGPAFFINRTAAIECLLTYSSSPLFHRISAAESSIGLIVGFQIYLAKNIKEE